jgi:hypothetical protein
MICLFKDGFGCSQGVPEDKISQVSVVDRHCSQKQSFFLGSNPQRHPTIVFYRYSRHGSNSSVMLYIFKQYIKNRQESTVAGLD